MHEKYSETFLRAATELADIRSWLEKPRTDVALKRMLKQANTMITSVLKDIKAFGKLCQTYT